MICNSYTMVVGIIVDNCRDYEGKARVRGQLAYDNPDVAMV